MRRLKTLSALFVAMLLMGAVSSCEKQNEPLPQFTIEATLSTTDNISNKGGEVDVTITTKGTWEVEIPAEATWLSATPLSGSGDATVTLVAEANELSTIRTAEVTVSTSTHEATITVSQVAMGTDLPSEIIQFADPKFKNILLNKSNVDENEGPTRSEDIGIYHIPSVIDANGDGEISYSEAEAVTQISAYDSRVESIEGIEYFTSLEVIALVKSNLQMVDLSNNTALKVVEITDANLSTIDLSSNSEIETIDLNNNLISSIKIGENKVTSLQLSSNPISTLDLSNLPALTYLNISFSDIRSIDISHNRELLEFHSARTGMEALDISNNEKLSRLGFRENNLTQINLSNNPLLTYIDLRDSDLKEIDLSMNTLVDDLDLRGNSLTQIDLSNNTALRFIKVNGNHLESIDVSMLNELVEESQRLGSQKADDKITGIICTAVMTEAQRDLPILSSYDNNDINIHIAGTPIPSHEPIVFEDPIFKSALINDGVDLNSDGEISYFEASIVSEIYHIDTEISSIKGIEHFTALDELTIARGNLSGGLDLSKNINLTSLTVFGNDITSLNITGCTKLSYIDISWNEFTTLELVNLPNLKYLDAEYNDLETINIETLTELTSLKIYKNNLSSFDASMFSKLEKHGLKCGKQEVPGIFTPQMINVTMSEAQRDLPIVDLADDNFNEGVIVVLAE